MALSFLSYRADRTPLLSYSFLLFLLQLHPFHHIHYILLFLPFHPLFLPLSNSMLPCNFYITYCTTTPCSGNLVPCSPEFLFLCSCTLYTLQRSSPPIMSSTLPCSSLPLLVAVLLPYYAFSPSPISLVLALLSPFFFFFPSLDIPTSYVPPLHT